MSFVIRGQFTTDEKPIPNQGKKVIFISKFVIRLAVNSFVTPVYDAAKLDAS